MKTGKGGILILLAQTFLVLGALFALALAFLSYRAISALPDPRDLARLLRMKTPTLEDLSQPADFSDEPEPDAISRDVPDESATAKRIREKEMLARLLEIADEDPSDIRVCEHLGKTTLPSRQAEIEVKVLLNSLFSEDRADSVSEAFRAPIRAILSSSGMRNVLEEVRVMESSGVPQQISEERPGLMEKVRFYARVAKAAAELYADRKRVEALSDRSMHLYALTRLAQLKHELATDTALLGTCREIQNAAVGIGRAELQMERERVLRHFRKAGVDPKIIGWDPKQWIRFQAKATRDGLVFGLLE